MKYTPKEIANIVNEVQTCYDRSEEYTQAKFGNDERILLSTSKGLLKSIRKVLKIPIEIRKHVMFADLNDGTLNMLEKECKKVIIKKALQEVTL